MTARETLAWGDLTDDVYIILDFGTGDEVHHIAKVFNADGRTSVIYSTTGNAERHNSLDPVELATAEEIADYQRHQDRLSVCQALSRLGSRIVDEGLPVPPGGKGIVLSFDLADDADLGPWAEYLSTRPKRATSRPLVQAEAEGVEVYVYGPGTSGEFGPELADAPSVEHRDAVGAFPVVAENRTSNDSRPLPSYDPNPTLAMRVGDDPSDAYASYAAWLDELNPGWWKDDTSRMAGGLAIEARKRCALDAGYSVSDGHRPQVDDEAMKHDRHSGEG